MRLKFSIILKFADRKPQVNATFLTTDAYYIVYSSHDGIYFLSVQYNTVKLKLLSII